MRFTVRIVMYAVSVDDYEYALQVRPCKYPIGTDLMEIRIDGAANPWILSRETTMPPTPGEVRRVAQETMRHHDNLLSNAAIMARQLGSSADDRY